MRLMLRYLDVVPLLRSACPSFDGSPEAALIERGTGEHIEVGLIVQHLIRLAEIGDTGSFAPVFDVVEHVLTEGDLEARNLVVAGFLDDLTNGTLSRGNHRDPRVFAPWFGPRTRRVPLIAELLQPDV